MNAANKNSGVTTDLFGVLGHVQLVCDPLLLFLGGGELFLRLDDFFFHENRVGLVGLQQVLHVQPQLLILRVQHRLGLVFNRNLL